MALKRTNFVRGQNSQRGLAGYLGFLFQKYGTATVASGDTSIVVTDTKIDTNDIIIASVLTKGANAAYVTGVTISDAASFTINVNTDPGAGGAVIAYLILRPTS